MMIIQRVLFLFSENCIYEFLFKSNDFFQIEIEIEFLQEFHKLTIMTSKNNFTNFINFYFEIDIAIVIKIEFISL